jgi:hypothetical protein
MSLDVAAWPGLRLAARVLEGNRNEVWRGSIDGRAVSIRQSRRTEPSLDWELDLIAHLDSLGFTVPTVVAAGDGSRHVGRVVVQRWLDGHAPVSTLSPFSSCTEPRWAIASGQGVARSASC